MYNKEYRHSKRYWLALGSSELVKIPANDIREFRFVSWSKVKELIFPDVLHIGE